MDRGRVSSDEILETDGAPDSWEMVDLEASMKKLLASSDAPGPCYQHMDRDRRGQISFSSSSSSDLDGGDADPDGVDSFLREALQGKDRLTILRLEQEVEKFMRSPKLQQLEFQPMPSSYLRLVAHRVVQHYNLQSSVADSSTPDGTRIVARKTAETRFPRVRLADVPIYSHAEEKPATSTQQTFELKRRPNKSSRLREGNSSGETSGRLNPPKSVEERKEEYNRARARIFSNSDGGGKVEEENLVLDRGDSFDNDSLHYDKRGEQASDAIARAELYNGFIRTANVRSERGSPALYKGNNRVAIFRDREKDRKDPDYDRNYDRYSQRFDPGFGVSQGPPYGAQALYSQVINYNTEFPQLGGPIRPQMCVEPRMQRTTPQPIGGPWGSSTSGLNYGHPDSMMGSFSTGHASSQNGTGAYVHPQQFPRVDSTIAYLHPQERFQQPVLQSHLQPEGSKSQPRHQ